MDCIVHGVAKSWTRLSDFHLHFSTIHQLQIRFRPLSQSVSNNDKDSSWNLQTLIHVTIFI